MLRETGLGEWSVHPVHPDVIETLVEIGDLDGAIGPTDAPAAYGLGATAGGAARPPPVRAR